MIIIALKGKNGSGKSTVAGLLSEKLNKQGINNKVLSFAEPLKKIVDNLFTDFKQGFDWENRVSKENARSLLEETADAIKSAFSFNPFILQLEQHLLYTIPAINIVTDLRFVQEYESLAERIDIFENDKLFVVEITNPLTDSNPDEYQLNLISSDYTIEFNNTLNEQLDELLTKIL